MSISTERALPETQVLQETMARLEAALLAPPIAGEMAHWTREIKQAAATLATDWTRELNCVLQPQYEQISQTDPEMSSCVEQLLRDDQALSEELVHFHEKLHQLEEATAHVDWQESKLTALQKRVEEDGVQLIHCMKKQLAAAATWLTEALYRDRGGNES